MTPTFRPAAGSGYTLLELMVVITILGIMMALAVPGFSYLAANTKTKSASSDLHLTLLKGRSEAVKRSTAVTITPTNTSDWALGWEMTAGGTSLQVQGPLDGVKIEPRDSDNNAITPASLVYQSTGRPSTGTMLRSFNIGQKTRNTSQESEVDVQRCVSIAANGAPYLKDEAC